MNGLPPDALLVYPGVPPVTRSYVVEARVTGLCQKLDGRRHPMWIVWVQPERLLQQRWHRRHDAVAGEIEPMGEPALAGQETHELFRDRNVPALLEDGTIDIPGPDGERLAVGGSRPS